MDFKGNVIQVDRHNSKTKVNILKSVSIPFPFQPFINAHAEGIELKPGFVYEFIYDYEECEFKPVLLRADKTLLGVIANEPLIDFSEQKNLPVLRTVLYEAITCGEYTIAIGLLDAFEQAVPSLEKGAVGGVVGGLVGLIG